MVEKISCSEGMTPAQYKWKIHFHSLAKKIVRVVPAKSVSETEINFIYAKNHHFLRMKMMIFLFYLSFFNLPLPCSTFHSAIYTSSMDNSSFNAFLNACQLSKNSLIRNGIHIKCKVHTFVTHLF